MLRLPSWGWLRGDVREQVEEVQGLLVSLNPGTAC